MNNPFSDESTSRNTAVFDGSGRRKAFFNRLLAGRYGLYAGSQRREGPPLRFMVCTALEPAADQLADLVNGLGCEAVALDLQALQVLGDSHLEAQDFQNQVGLLQQGLPLPIVLRSDQDFQQVVEIAFNPLAQHGAVVARKLVRVLARPQDQVIRLRDDNQFFVPFQVSHVFLLDSVHMYKFIPIFVPFREGGKQ